METDIAPRWSARMKIQLYIDGTLRTISLEQSDDGSCSGELDGRPFRFDAVVTTPGVVSLVLYDVESGAPTAFRCIADASDDAGDAEGKTILVGPLSFRYQVHDPRSLATRRKRLSGEEGTLLLKATMAGRVVRILVEEGSEVEAHAGIVVIEAMKMQNELRALRPGRVTHLRVATGEMVSAGQVLAVIE
jgi:biotin carboxyl carrier protein